MNVQKIMQEMMDQIRELAKNYDPNYDAGNYWESGNFDDCFSEGQTSGENFVYERLTQILNEANKKLGGE